MFSFFVAADDSRHPCVYVEEGTGCLSTGNTDTSVQHVDDVLLQGPASDPPSETGAANAQESGTVGKGFSCNHTGTGDVIV